MKPQTYIISLLSLLFVGCAEDLSLFLYDKNSDTAQTRAGQKEGEVFYYYGIENRKIYLDRVTDKVFVKFAPTATKEQFRSVVDGNKTSLRSIKANSVDSFVEGDSFNTALPSYIFA